MVEGLRRIVLAALFVAGGGLAGCLGEAAVEEVAAPAAVLPLPPPVEVLSDPDDDAREANSHLLAGAVPCARVAPDVAGAPETPWTCAAAAPMWALPPTGVVPAAPTRDLVAVRVAETPRDLVVELDLAALGDAFDGAYDLGTGDGTQYLVVWEHPAAECFAAVVLWIQPAADGVWRLPFLIVGCGEPDLERTGAGRCPNAFCVWDVPFEHVAGTPGTLRWTVPRALLPGAEAGDEVRSVYASTLNSANGRGAMRTGAWIDGPLTLGYWSPGQAWYAFDEAWTEDGLALTLPRMDAPAPAGPVVLERVPRIVDAEVPERPHLRLDRTSLEQRGAALRYTFTLGSVTDTPPDHFAFSFLGLPGYEIGVGWSARDGQRTPFANLYVPDRPAVNLPVEVTVEPGEPGRVHLDVPVRDLPPLPPDARVLFHYSFTSTFDETALPAGSSTVHLDQWDYGDATSLAANVPFHLSAPSAADAATRFLDDAGDVVPPPDLLRPRERYDLLGVDVTSSAPGEIRISLAVQDLADLDPQPGYDDVFYAVGVETERGQTMLGYYRGVDEPAGTFFCAPDTTVFQVPRGDPRQSSGWNPILGRVLGASSADALGTSADVAGSAAFVLFAPAECFGLERDAETLEVSALRAGSYLVRRGAAGAPQAVAPSTELDALDADRAFSVTFARPVVVGPPWWVEPFGVQDFWEILGTLLALVTILVTFLLFLRRRRLMKWYLAQLQTIEKAHPDPHGRAGSLVALRRQLHRDIVRHRVSDPQYILDRLRASITSARLVSISDGYYDLPAPLALRIERLLDDGRLTAEEASLLEPLIAKTRLEPEARDRLAVRLRTWVAEDAGDMAV